MSNTLKEIPESHRGKAFLVKGRLAEIITQIHGKGFNWLYVDGGTTIQSFFERRLN